MENVRTQVTELTSKVLEFAKTMEADDALAKGTGLLEILEKATTIYNKKELYVLVSGEVKAGKSSLINSILGEDICTVNGGVCTNTNTLIRYGETEKITVYFAQQEGEIEPDPESISRDKISDFVSERKNKNNKKSVRLIVVETPNEHLKSGLVLIDTPGLGSLNPLHAATTFSMAPMADVIILVATAKSELKETEISYIKQLLECSKSKLVIHALTHSDQGDPDTILTKNIAHLNKIKKWKEGELQCCKISNKNFVLFKNGKITNIEATGFDKFFNILHQLENDVDNIMSERQLEQILVVLQKYGTTLNILLQSFSSPEKAAEKRTQIERAKVRLEELTSESTIWRNALNGEIKKLETRAIAEVKQNYRSLKECTETKLQLDEFLKYPDKLGGVIAAESIKLNANLQDYLAKEFTDTYTWLKEHTELSLIQKELVDIDEKIDNLQITNIQIDKAGIYRNAFLSNMFMYGTVGGTVVGGLLGGIIGSIVPGPGTVAGAVIGAKIGAIVGSAIGGVVSLFKGSKKVKQEKRKKIMGEIIPVLNSSQAEMEKQVKLVITDGQTELINAFTRELSNEKARCSNILKGLDSDSLKRKQISDLKCACDKLQAIAAKIFTSLKKQ